MIIIPDTPEEKCKELKRPERPTGKTVEEGDARLHAHLKDYELNSLLNSLVEEIAPPSTCNKGDEMSIINFNPKIVNGNKPSMRYQVRTWFREWREERRIEWEHIEKEIIEGSRSHYDVWMNEWFKWFENKRKGRKPLFLPLFTTFTVLWISTILGGFGLIIFLIVRTI